MGRIDWVNVKRVCRSTGRQRGCAGHGCETHRSCEREIRQAGRTAVVVEILHPVCDIATCIQGKCPHRGERHYNRKSWADSTEGRPGTRRATEVKRVRLPVDVGRSEEHTSEL